LYIVIVTLRTVDNFQGEEATIVILSLVRNTSSGNHGTIGFLRSPNRTNVLLSRAKHGMFMLGIFYNLKMIFTYSTFKHFLNIQYR